MSKNETLPLSIRQTVLNLYWEERTLKEIAALTGLAVNRVIEILQENRDAWGDLNRNAK